MSEVKYIKKAPDASFVDAAKYNASLVSKDFSGALLDIGAYKGLVKDYLPKNINYMGLDLQDWGKTYIKEVNLNNGEIPFETNSFDMVIAANVIEHLLMRPEKILEEIKRVAKEDAQIIISLPNDRGIASLLIGGSGLLRLKSGVNSLNQQEYGHHWMYDKKVATELLSQYFTVQEVLSRSGVLLSKIPIIRNVELLTSDMYFICVNDL